MQKLKGFTLIELLATMAIIAILVTISIPNLQGMRQTNNFRGQTQVIWDQISEARSSAITNKKCSNGDIAAVWQVIFSDLPTTEIKHTLNCITTANLVSVEAAEATLLDTDVSFLDIDGVAEDLNTPVTEVIRINFLSGSAQTKLEQVETDTTENRIDDLRIVFAHTFELSDLQQSLCLNRVAGFPLINKYSDTCES